MRLRLLAFVFSILSGGSASADPSWTVETMVQKALAANPELRAYEAEIAAAKGQRQQAGLWKNPEISGEYGHRRVSDNTAAADGFTRSIALTQTFEFPGKASLRQAMAEHDVQLAELGVRQFRAALRGQVKSLAYRYVIASREVETAEEISERCHGLIELLAKRPAAGTTPYLELKVIEASLFELQQSSRDLTQIRDEAAIELKRFLGLPKSQALTVTAPPDMPAIKSDSTSLLLRGLGENIQLKMRKAEVEKAITSISAAKLEAAPDFSVGPFFSQDNALDDEINIGGSISTTLPLWNWNQGNVATAKARRAQADALLMDARAKVESEIQRRLRSLELTQKQLAQMPGTTLTNLREAADLADRQYRTGLIGVQLFLETQRGFLAAQKIHSEAQLSAWRDLLDLELLCGGADLSGPSVKEAKN